jgi:hypothetical protein
VLGQLDVTITNTWNIYLQRKKDLFWLIVLEVPFLTNWPRFFQACSKAAHRGSKKPLTSWQKREKGRCWDPHFHSGHTLNELKTTTIWQSHGLGTGRHSRSKQQQNSTSTAQEEIYTFDSYIYIFYWYHNLYPFICVYINKLLRLELLLIILSFSFYTS